MFHVKHRLANQILIPFLIAKNASINNIKDTFFLATLIFNFLIILLTYLIPFFAFDSNAKTFILKDVAISSTFISCLILNIYFLSKNLGLGNDNRNLYLILTKAITRRDYFLGNVLGILISSIFLYSFVYTLTYFILIFDVFNINDFKISQSHIKYLLDISIYFEHSVFAYFSISLLCSVLMVLVCATLSMRMSFLMNILVCLFIYLAGSSLAFMESAGSLFSLNLIKLILPNFYLFNLSDMIVYETKINGVDLLLFTAYSLVYSSFLAFLGVLLFNKKEL